MVRREAILLVAFGMLLATSVAYGVPNLTVEWQKEYRDPYELHQTCTSALQAFDVDGDGDIEIILPFRKDSDRIVCVSGSDGSVEWIYPPMEQEPTSGDPMGAPAIGDMDGDGKYEVVFLGRSNNIYCIDGTTGAGKWIYECEGADDAVMLYDIDGDGYKDADGIVIKHWQIENELNQALLTAIWGWRSPVWLEALLSPWADWDFCTELLATLNRAVHESDPDAIAKIWIDPVEGLSEATARSWVEAAKLNNMEEPTPRPFPRPIW